MKLEVLSLGLVLLLAVLRGVWKTASLRGDTFHKWRKRVELAEVGLSEQAAEELRHMQLEINRLLGTEDQFDPRRVVADPGELRAGVLRLNVRLKRLIETRERLQGRFRLLLRLAPIFFWTLIPLAAGIALTFTYLGGIASSPLLGDVGIAVSAVSGVVLVICFGVYVYLQESLSRAEILSAFESSND